MMKKRLTLTSVLIFTLFLSSFGQKGFKNPAAIYAEAMGYGFKTKTDAKGNQFGVTVLPSGKEVNAWDLYKGKVEPQYSYCAKKGYLVKTTSTNVEGYQTECAVCYSGSNLKSGEEIPMLDLMKKNGDLPAQEEKSQETQAISSAKIDPHFKAAQALPTSFDWRSYNGHSYIGAVRNQGNCGDCYAFGATACAEGVYNFATGLYDSNCADFSEGYISFCLGSMSAYSSHFYGCNGADYTYSELQALVDIGTCNESYFPYSDATSQSCPTAATNASKTKFLNWFRPPCSDITSIKTAIMTYGIVDAAVYVDAAFQNYTSGIFSNTSTACDGSPCDYTTTNHAIALVGWGYDATVGDYWILRNSWGSSWGESGYMRIAATSARVACSVAYLTYSAGTTISVTGVSLNTSTLALTTGQTSTLVATIAPTNATNQNVSWTSSNTSVATVSSSGVVTAVAVGSATITVTTADGNKTATCGVTVTTPTATYCTSKGNSVTDEWINRVVLNTIDKTSGANSGYADFTAISTSLTIGGTYTITIYPSWSGSTYSEGYAVWIDLNNDKDFADTGELLFSNAATTSTSISGTLAIPSGTSANTTRMRVAMKYNAIPTSCETFSYGEVEDYTINLVAGTVSCNTPTNIAASSITSAGATISWSAVSGASSYDVHYRVTGTTSWTSVNTTSTSITLSGLSASTGYDYEVRTNCSSGSSAYSSTQSFTTLATTLTYCTSKGSSSTYEWISGVAIGTFSNTSSAAGYTDFTSKTINLTQGTAYSITLTPGFSSSTYTEYWKIWVDLNKDGDFADSGEELLASAGSKTAVSSTITIPSTALGSTRLRVSMKYNATPTSCETFSYGEVEDYTVAIAAKASSPGESKEISPSTTATDGLEVYPTIVENLLYFKATNLGTISSIKIYTYLGELAEDAPLNIHDNSINVAKLNSGVYILCIKTEKGMFKTKFIKN